MQKTIFQLESWNGLGNTRPAVYECNVVRIGQAVLHRCHDETIDSLAQSARACKFVWHNPSPNCHKLRSNQPIRKVTCRPQALHTPREAPPAPTRADDRAWT